MGAVLSFFTTLSPTSSTLKPTALPQSPEEEISEIVPGTDSPPYWQVNVPEAQKELVKKCPEFLELRRIKERHRDMISVPSDQFHYLEWEEVKRLIDNDNIDLFARAPADHRRYLAFAYYIQHAYGSLETFVQVKRLNWIDLTPKGAPFTNTDDLKIIYNDWPYGFDSRIVHLCVWTKFQLPNDEKTKRLKPEVRQQIDDYVEKTFRSRVPADQVRWFKNWDKLKSIHKMEHFHVMMFDPDVDFIKEITDNGAPISLSI